MSANGQLPDSALSKIPGGRLKMGAPARSWLAMRYYIMRHYRGLAIVPTGPSSSYRTLAKQREFFANYQNGTGPLAARPGTSNHGLGLAVDVPTAQMQAAIRECGHLFGWGIRGGRLASDAPSEAWHCTYRGPYTRFARGWYWRRRLAIRRSSR